MDFLTFDSKEKFDGLDAISLVTKMSEIVFGYTSKDASKKQKKEDCLFSKYNHNWISFYKDFKNEYFKRLDDGLIEHLKNKKLVHPDGNEKPVEKEKNFKRYIERYGVDENYKPEQLKEVILILVSLLKKFTNSTKSNIYPKEEDKLTKLAKVDNSKKEIELLFHLFLDSGLPLYFYQGLSRDLHIHLVETNNWSIDSDSFESGHTDVILHSFSHAVALNKSSLEKIVFLPLFEFKGYSLIVKKQPLSILQDDSSSLLFRGNKWFNYILQENLKFHVEKETDLYWIAFEYFKKKVKNKLTGYSDTELLDEFEKHIIDSNNIEHFVKDENAVILSTNNMFATYFKQDKIKTNYHIIDGRNHIQHKNLNGFIFTESFAKNNIGTIIVLVNNWFKQVELLKKTYDRIIENKSRNNKFDDSYINPFDNFCNILNDRHGVNIDSQQMASNFKFQNTFFDNLTESLKSFDDNINSNINDYLELCRINYEKFKVMTNSDGNIEIKDLTILIEGSKKIINRIDEIK